MRQTFENLKQIGTGPYQDYNFCTVAALAMALDWSFGKAHRHMAKHGRKNKRGMYSACLLYTSPSPRDGLLSRMPSSA